MQATPRTAVLPDWRPQAAGTDFLSSAQRNNFQSPLHDFRQLINWVTPTPPPTNGGGGSVHNNDNHGNFHLRAADDLASLRKTIRDLNEHERMGITEIIEPQLGRQALISSRVATTLTRLCLPYR